MHRTAFHYLAVFAASLNSVLNIYTHYMCVCVCVLISFCYSISHNFSLLYFYYKQAGIVCVWVCTYVCADLSLWLFYFALCYLFCCLCFEHSNSNHYTDALYTLARSLTHSLTHTRRQARNVMRRLKIQFHPQRHCTNYSARQQVNGNWACGPSHSDRASLGCGHA